MPDQHNFCHDHVNLLLLFIYMRFCTMLLFCNVSLSETLQFINKYLVTLERPVISFIDMSC